MTNRAHWQDRVDAGERAEDILIRRHFSLYVTHLTHVANPNKKHVLKWIVSVHAFFRNCLLDVLCDRHACQSASLDFLNACGTEVLVVRLLFL